MTNDDQVASIYVVRSFETCDMSAGKLDFRPPGRGVLETRHENRREASQPPEVDSRAGAFFKDSLK